MNEQQKLHLENLQKEILIDINEYDDLEKERFFSQLADWAYNRHEYLTQKL